MMVVIFFTVARRNPITGCLSGAIIGMLQDTLTAHPIGMYGIADTIIGFAASSLGVKIDVENHGTRFLITYIFFVAHQGIYFGVAHGLLRQAVQWSWSQVAISALANAVVGIFYTRSEAEQAIRDLHTAGFPDDKIGMIARDSAGRMVAEKIAVAAAAHAAAAHVRGRGFENAATAALVPVKRAVRANRRRLSRAKRVDAVVSHLRRLMKG